MCSSDLISGSISNVLAGVVERGVTGGAAGDIPSVVADGITGALGGVLASTPTAAAKMDRAVREVATGFDDVVLNSILTRPQKVIRDLTSSTTNLTTETAVGVGVSFISSPGPSSDQRAVQS